MIESCAAFRKLASVAAGAVLFACVSQAHATVVLFAAGPVRDFYLAASEHYQVTSRTVGQTTVNSYAPENRRQGLKQP